MSKNLLTGIKQTYSILTALKVFNNNLQDCKLSNSLNFRIPVFTHKKFVRVSTGTRQTYLTILFCILTVDFKWLGQDVKRYVSDVRLDNRKVVLAPSPRKKYFKRLFLSIYNNRQHHPKQDIQYWICG